MAMSLKGNTSLAIKATAIAYNDRHYICPHLRLPLQFVTHVIKAVQIKQKKVITKEINYDVIVERCRYKHQYSAVDSVNWPARIDLLSVRPFLINLLVKFVH